MTTVSSEKSKNSDLFSKHLSIPKKEYRNLTGKEIALLKMNHNHAENWDNFFVCGNFNPDYIKYSEFNGPIFLATFENKQSNFENLHLHPGIYNSTISHSIVGKNAVLKNVRYLHNYIIGDEAILLNIDEITCSTNASFGNGYLNGSKDRTFVDIANENGGRKILPFEGILPADALLWSRFREDTLLLKKLTTITDKIASDTETIGIIGDKSVIKNSCKIKDCKIGSHAIIDGATQLVNLTIQSSEKEPSFIGDSADLNNGIIGFSNKIVHAPKCINFVTGRNVKIELGARVIHTMVGANSTIACCEVLNNLIFPFHEQHHNNSFLIASTVSGQSNIAAGATIGSNHNSRAADGEILAERGFWPGLNSSFKHNSYFASFTLVAKESYETELNVKLPFSLISKDKASGRLQIFPAFWFRYNMYALARNSWKFNNRDKRVNKEQNIEMGFLAPDTAQEMLAGISIIEQAVKEKTGSIPIVDETNFNKQNDLSDIYLSDMAPKEKTLLIKPIMAIWLYKLMLSYFAAKEIIGHIRDNGTKEILSLFKDDFKPIKWMNFGGQLIAENDYKKLIQDIKNDELNSWDLIHHRYNELWKEYKEKKRGFAVQCWLQKEGKSGNDISENEIVDLLNLSETIDKYILQWTKESRLKDYSNPYRQITYRNEAEMNAVLGKYEENSFIKKMDDGHKEFIKTVKKTISQLKKK